MFDPLAEALVAVKELAAEDRAGWSPQARSARVRELVGLAERVQAEVLRAVGEWDAAQAWADDGSLSGPAWLAWQTPLTKSVAVNTVRTGRFLHRHPATAAALADREITATQAELLARVERHHTDDFTAAEDTLLSAARGLSAQEFSTVARRWVELVDDRAPHDHSRRHLSLAQTFQSWWAGQLLLDPEGGALVARALDAIAGPDPSENPEGPRSRGQRLADNLIELCRRSVRGELGTAPSSTVDFLILSKDHHLAAALDPTASPPTDVNTIHAERGARSHLPPRTIARLLCDSPIGRILTNTKSEILDVGRRQRLFTAAQRRALVARDGGCVFPGCDRPAHWCDTHHLQPWERGGHTNLDNGILLCRRHHVLLHEGCWTLRRDATTGTITATSPDGRTFNRKPRLTAIRC